MMDAGPSAEAAIAAARRTRMASLGGLRVTGGSQSLEGVVVFMGDGGLLWTGALGCRKGRC
jgi:hypothetical protein